MNLMHKVNTMATLIAMKTSIPALNVSKGSIVTISPPIHLANLDWISNHPEYTISKYSMTLATLGIASNNIRSNCIWPRYTIATSATKRLEDEGYIGAFTDGRVPAEFAFAVHDLAISKLNAQTVYDDEIIELPDTDAPLDVFAKACTRHLCKN